MEYYNIQKDTMEEVNISNVYDLIGIHDCLKDSIQSIVKDLKEKIINGEELPTMAYNVVFEHLAYENDSINVIEFIKTLMQNEEGERLPKLSAFSENKHILIEMYEKAMDYFFDSDLSDYMQPQVVYDPPETNCIFLSNFMYKMNINTKEDQEWLKNKIKEWKHKASEQFATIATNYKNDENVWGYTTEDYLNMANRALFFNPDNTKALQLKVWCLEQEVDE